MQPFEQLAAKNCKSLYQIPCVESGYILAENSVLLKLSQTDVVRAKKRSYVTAKLLAKHQVTSFPFPCDIGNVSIISPSPSGQQLGLVRVDESKKDEAFLEIWTEGNLHKIISLKGKHGQVYADEWFCSFEWSPDEKYIVYIAEPIVEGYSFWDNEAKDPTKKGSKFAYKEDWGEALSGMSSPCLYVLEVESETIYHVNTAELHLSCGQAIWSHNSKELVFVGWPYTRRRLGLKHCYNRGSGLYSLSLSDLITLDTNSEKTDFGKIIQLLTSDPSSNTARSPRFSPDGSALVYLATQNMITHNGCSKLCKLDWRTKVSSTVIDIVTTPNGGFTGIFTHALPRRPFIGNTKVLFSSAQRTPMVPFIVDITSGEVQQLIVEGIERASVNVLDTNGASFIVVASNPTTPHTVLYGELGEVGINGTHHVKWTVLHKPPQNELLSQLTWQVTQIVPSSEPKNLTFDIVEHYPKGVANPPLLLYPHGGPHSSFVADYQVSVVLLISLGFAVTMVNYRGSTGFGADFVNSLPGRCGELDVHDCEDATLHILAQNKVSHDKLAVIGGSHGGFIAGHLISSNKAHINWKACVMRNPVTNIPAMLSATDIPDWCFVETGSTMQFSVPNIENLKTMLEHSPIANIARIKTPTLFLIGEVDKRVPPSQGLSLYYALRERDIPTSAMFYPKNGHALSGADAEPDLWVSTAIWCNKFLN